MPKATQLPPFKVKGEFYSKIKRRDVSAAVLSNRFLVVLSSAQICFILNSSQYASFTPRTKDDPLSLSLLQISFIHEIVL